MKQSNTHVCHQVATSLNVLVWGNKDTRNCWFDVHQQFWENIRQYFHCNDNSACPSTSDQNYDKLFKVRPVIDYVLDKCKSVSQEKMQSVDEQIIPTKSRCWMKQYTPKKSNKWGIKVWARCGISGIVYDFEIYANKAPNTQDEIPDIMMGGNVVHRFTKILPYHQNFKLYFDIFYLRNTNEIFNRKGDLSCS